MRMCESNPNDETHSTTVNESNERWKSSRQYVRKKNIKKKQKKKKVTRKNYVKAKARLLID